MTTTIQEYSKTEAAISALQEQYADVTYEVTTTSGMKDAKAARSEVKGYRIDLEKMRKEIKAPALDRCRAIDAEAKRITAELVALESPIDAQIKEEESRAERERQEKIDAEVKRVEAIHEHISDIRTGYEKFTRFDVTADQIQVQITGLAELEITEGLFQEFMQQAVEAKSAVLTQLRDAHAAAVEREENNRKAAEAQAELDKLRKANEDREAKEQAEREKADAEARKKRETEEKKKRAELETQRKAQAAAQKKIDDENKRIADERAVLEKEQREDRERKEAEKRAAAKAKADAEAAAKKSKYPGDEMIIKVLADHFGVKPEVATGWLTQFRKAA